MTESIYNLSFEELQAKCLTLGLKKYKAKQVSESLYNQKLDNFNKMTSLSKEERSLMAENFQIFSLSNIEEFIGEDTVKYRGELSDGIAIEWVIIQGKKRKTVCISTQAGCKLKCKFCATGTRIGFQRDLSASEIVEQVMHVLCQGHEINNVVYMGMGEPLLNYDAVIRSIRLLIDENSLNMGARRFTISTAGILPGIVDLISEGLQVNLAISLHAANDLLRSKLMPINKKYPITGILDAGEKYRDESSRRVTLEYILLKGINDTKNDAYELIQLISYRDFHVNLIPYNETGDEYKPSDKSTIDSFLKMLTDAGVNATIRNSKGGDINAACGMLANGTKD